jgi:hypothetical protein
MTDPRPTLEEERRVIAAMDGDWESAFDALAAELARLRAENAKLREALLKAERRVRIARRFHFAHNPPNTGLAASFNGILDVLGAPDVPEDTSRIEVIDAILASAGSREGMDETRD